MFFGSTVFLVDQLSTYFEQPAPHNWESNRAIAMLPVNVQQCTACYIIHTNEENTLKASLSMFRFWDLLSSARFPHALAQDMRGGWARERWGLLCRLWPLIAMCFHSHIIFLVKASFQVLLITATAMVWCPHKDAPFPLPGKGDFPCVTRWSRSILKWLSLWFTASLGGTNIVIICMVCVCEHVGLDILGPFIEPTWRLRCKHLCLKWKFVNTKTVWTRCLIGVSYIDCLPIIKYDGCLSDFTVFTMCPKLPSLRSIALLLGSFLTVLVNECLPCDIARENYIVNGMLW